SPVTANGISGTGTVGLNLVDDGSIHDAAGNPLQASQGASFAPQQTFASGLGTSLATADFNRDGNPDLIITDKTANVLDVLLGNGNGTFRAEQTYAAGP